MTYTDISLEQYGDALRANGTPEAFVEASVGLESVKAQGWSAQVSPHVSEVLGRPPQTYGDFIARNRDRLPLARRRCGTPNRTPGSLLRKTRCLQAAAPFLDTRSRAVGVFGAFIDFGLP